MKQFAVYHSNKGKGSGGGLGNHIDRVKGMEHTFKNADPERTNLNIEFISEYKDLSLPNAIEKRIKQGYNGKRKIRTDAVKYLTHILTGSHNQMQEIFSNRKAKENWILENYRFACQEFGKENIIRFTLHLDEKTPHLHCVTVPITKDGRLSSKEIFGNQKVLKERQNKYAEMMKPFGLMRGLDSSITGAKHETAQEYQKRLSNNNQFKTDFKAVKGFFGTNKNKSIEEAKKRLKTAENIIKSQNIDIENKEKQIKNIYSEVTKNRELEKELDKRNQELTEKYKSVKSILVNVLHYEDQLEEVRRANNIKPKSSKKEEERKRIEREIKLQEKEMQKKKRGLRR